MLHIDPVFLHIPGLNCLWWLLLAMLLPLLLGLLLGYWLWYQYKRQAAAFRAERDDYHARFVDMEKEYASLKYQYDELLKDNNALRTSLHSTEADIAVLKTKLERSTAAGQAREAEGGPMAAGALNYGALFAADNLQIIEGIGPKVEQVLKTAGVANWSMLSFYSTDDLNDILAAAGPAYKMMDPASWPRQAQLAAAGKWDELVEYQKFLDTGREDQGDFQTPSKVEQMALRLSGQSPAARGAAPNRFAGVFQPDNLQVIEGVGPKLEEVLRQAGFGSWPAVAAATPAQLAEALTQADPAYRIHDPATWPRQAQLAAEGKWDELVEYQKFLDTGREGKGDFSSPAKVEKLLLSTLGFASAQPDDLKIVEGIGPKIEQLLKDAGIRTWSDLARATVDELRDILADAGERYRLADPGTWPRQAGLAAAGDWKALKEYQDFLEGGKDPGAGA